MKLFYIYPERIPQKNAREISVLNTFFELKKLCDSKFVTINFDCDLNYINYVFDLNLTRNDFIVINKNFLFIKSTKIFNFRLLKIIKDKNNKNAIFYTRHLKIAFFLNKHKNSSQKVVFEAHECFSIQNKNMFSIEKSVLIHSNLIVCHNYSTKTELERFFNIKLANFLIAYNGSKSINEFYEKDFIFNKINYYGNLLPWKGVDLLFELLDSDKNLYLHIYGNDKNADGDKLKDFLKGKSYQNRIIFEGYLSKIEVSNNLKVNTSILIIPSKKSVYSNYSTPLKLFEYLSTSNVVLAPDFSPIKEVIEDGVNGFLYEAENAKSLIDKFNKIKSMSPIELNRISFKAFEDSKQFNWENRAQNIISYLI